jgi:hypothetical protein
VTAFAASRAKLGASTNVSAYGDSMCRLRLSNMRMIALMGAPSALNACCSAGMIYLYD